MKGAYVKDGGALWQEFRGSSVKDGGGLRKGGRLSVRVGEQCKDWGLWAVQEGCGGMKGGSV